MLSLVSQFSFFDQEPLIWTVTELNRHIRQLLESDYRLQDLWVTGEVSNLSLPASCHLYFTLKDEGGALRCVMWRPDVARLFIVPRDGEAVEVHGRISIYEAGGQYQLYTDQIQPAGEGLLFREFLHLKERLELEGLFAPERKRSLPTRPARIGIVTSATAAALRDVVNVLRRRYPLAEVVLSPTPVQGEEAPPKIVNALRKLNEFVKPDVILIVRGGGSMEDLWAFNDEEVIRAIAASEAPVVSGIGHETDLVLADFAADVRAPTPSAAAEVATPDRSELRMELLEVEDHLRGVFSDLLRELSWRFLEQKSAIARASPQAKVLNARQQVDDLMQRVVATLRHRIALGKAAIAGLEQTLRVVGPAAVFARGFALVSKEVDGSVVRSIHQVNTGDLLKVQVADGDFGVTVREDDDRGEFVKKDRDKS
jgi:exodeoxyribonuclease VII large subunit